MKIICHMIASADGRLQSKFWSPLYDNSSTVTDIYEAVAAKMPSDGWMVGRKTMAEYGENIVIEKEPMLGPKTMQTSSRVGNWEDRPLAVVFDQRGKLHYKASTLPTGEHIVAILGSRVTRSYQKELEEVGVSYIMRTPGSHYEENMTAFRSLVKHFGVKTMLLEGGAITNGHLLQMGLVDELSIIVYPGIDGKLGRSSIVEYACEEENPMANIKLELKSCETVGSGYVWLRYNVHK